MLTSMTGYGSVTSSFKTDRGTLEISADIRSVNSKFLDLSIRSPRPYIPFDNDISKLVRSKLRRGRVDVTVGLRVIEGAAKDIVVNTAQAKSLLEALKKLRGELALAEEVRLSDLLRIPDWIESRESSIDLQKEWKFLASVIESALEQVQKSRLAEGAALEEAIQNHRDRFGETLEKIARSHDALLKNLRERTRERVNSLYGTEGLDPHRLEQEIVLWIARSDFQEELDRIRHHLETFDSLLEGKGELGRKLEFLVQELHREVNTLGSKCPDATVTPLVIELKTYIERIREQIQNIE